MTKYRLLTISQTETSLWTDFTLKFQILTKKIAWHLSDCRNFNSIHCTGNQVFFPDVLKRWFFQKKHAGIWFFFYYQERWHFFFPKIWSDLQTENERWSVSKKIYGDMAFSSNVPKRWSFQKGPRWDIFCTIWKGGWKMRERWPFSRNTRKRGFFYSIGSTPPCQEKSKTTLSRKNKPNSDWLPRKTP